MGLQLNHKTHLNPVLNLGIQVQYYYKKVWSNEKILIASLSMQKGKSAVKLKQKENYLQLSI